MRKRSIARPRREEPSASSSTALAVIRKIGTAGVDGPPGMQSAKELAAEYLNDPSYRTHSQRADALIRYESAKSFGTGFVTSLGSLPALPVTLTASLLASWAIQARLAAAVAEIYGHDSGSHRVRTVALLCVLGDGVSKALRHAGVRVGNKAAWAILSRIPGKVFTEINKQVSFRLMTKAGETGIVNVGKLVPLVGGVIGGAYDSSMTLAVGAVAKRLFRVPQRKALKAR